MTPRSEGARLRDDPLREESLICEALVREIGQATRWSAMVEAWSALVRVRQTADEMRRELCHLSSTPVKP